LLKTTKKGDLGVMNSEEMIQQQKEADLRLIDNANSILDDLSKNHSLKLSEKFKKVISSSASNLKLFIEAVKNDWTYPTKIDDSKCFCDCCNCNSYNIKLKMSDFMVIDFYKNLCDKCKEQHKNKLRSERIKSKVDERLHLSKIPKRHLLAEFDKLNSKRQELFNNVEFENHLWIVGKSGTGKTYTAVAYLKKIAEDFDVLFVRFSTLFDSDINQSIENFIKIRDFNGVLLIDDVGAISSKFWIDKFDDLILYRFEEMLPTIFTSNFENLKVLGDFLPERIYNRILSFSYSVVFKEL